MTMPAIRDPTADAKEVLSAFRDVKQELSAKDGEMLRESLQHCLARVQRITEHRMQRGRVVKGQTSEKGKSQTTEKSKALPRNSQKCLAEQVTSATSKQKSTREVKKTSYFKWCSDGLPFGGEFDTLRDHIGTTRKVSKPSCVPAKNDAVSERTRYGHKQNSEFKSARRESDHAPRDVLGQTRYFEIMSFKTINEGDCESEADGDISMNLEADVVFPAIGATTSSTSVGCSQASTDALTLEYEDILSLSSTYSLNDVGHDFEIAFDKACSAEKRTKSCESAAVGKQHVENLERSSDADDLADAIDLMGEAIEVMGMAIF